MKYGDLSFSRVFRISSVLCIVLCFYTTEINGQGKLPNPCKHNQFRCSSGAKCLSTEKLCNGVKDCAKGEDERGTPQWDCSKLTLSTPCDPISEVKCRYGGCISRDKLCDGTADCWGGNDEATDVCTARPPPKRPVQVSASRPVQQTTTPGRRYQTVQPTFAPKTNRPSQIVTESYPPPSQGQGQSQGGCPPLREEDQGYNITCYGKFNYPIDCFTSSVPVGTKAKYMCQRYHKATQTGGSYTERSCEANGAWSRRRSNFVCEVTCGEGGAESTTLIVGGFNTRKGKWPWIVALYNEDPPNSGKYQHFCGGTLIPGNAVLLAAHCVAKSGTSVIRNRSEIRVVLGKYYRSFSREESDSQTRTVRKIIIHEEYNHINYENDIAIIFLEEPIQITKYVRPVCLPTDEDRDIYQYFGGNEFGQLLGWGRSRDGKFKEDLQEAKLPVVNPRTCRDANPTFGNLVRSSTFCAGYRNGTSACDGDSGGGLVFRSQDRVPQWRVQGIVSAGIANADRAGCNERYYAVFTKVGHYLDWIHRQLDQQFKK